jgi:hypothetical protein
MSTESPAVYAALLRGILRDSAAVHDLLTARGCQAAGKPVSLMGARLLEQSEKCRTSEELCEYIDSL